MSNIIDFLIIFVPFIALKTHIKSQKSNFPDVYIISKIVILKIMPYNEMEREQDLVLEVGFLLCY